MADKIDYTKLDGPDMLYALGWDADKWADAFLQFNPKCNIDQHTLMAWFANAIMHNRDIVFGTVHNGEHAQYLIDKELTPWGTKEGE